MEIDKNQTSTKSP